MECHHAASAKEEEEDHNDNNYDYDTKPIPSAGKIMGKVFWDGYWLISCSDGKI
jgi:hypothetical protein